LAIDASQAALLLNDLNRARTYALKASRIDSQCGQSLAQLGTVAFHEQQFAEATNLMEKARNANWHGKDRERYWQMLALLTSSHLMLNNFGQSRALAEQVIEIRPDWPGPRLSLGRSLEFLGRHDEALTAYRQLVAHCPSFEPGRQALQRLRANNE